MEYLTERKLSMGTLREKALKGLAAFLVLMIVLTMLSRAADSLTVALVTTAAAQKRTIDHTIKADGIFSQNQEEAVTVVENILIRSVNVSKGSLVAAGDVLMELHPDDLQEQIQIIKNDIRELELNILAKKENAAIADIEEEKNLTRAKEEYDRAVSSGNTAVGKAYNAMTKAWKDWQDYKNSGSTVSAGDSQKEQEEALERTYEDKKTAYESAVESMNETLYAKENAIEDAVKVKEADYSNEIARMNMEEMQRKLSKLQALWEAEGKIYAPISGIVTEVRVSTGDLTPATKSFLVADLDSGYQFTAQLGENQKKYVSVGDEVILNLSGKKYIGGLTVEALTPNTEDANKTDVIVSVDNTADYFDELYIGGTAELVIENKSEAYATTVPLTAIHEENGSKYLLVVTESAAILGTQLSVEKMEVVVLDKNLTYAALSEGVLASGQKFVTDSSKDLEAGDRVRLAKE